MVAVGCFLTIKGRLVESAQTESARPSDMKKDDDSIDDNMFAVNNNMRKYSREDMDMSSNTISGVALYNPLIGTLGRIEKRNGSENDASDVDNSMNDRSTLTI